MTEMHTTWTADDVVAYEQVLQQVHDTTPPGSPGYKCHCRRGREHLGTDLRSHDAEAMTMADYWGLSEEQRATVLASQWGPPVASAAQPIVAATE